MKILKNYIESNWIFDLVVMILIPTSIWRIISQDTQLFLLTSFVIGLSITAIFRVYNVLRKVRNYKRKIDQKSPLRPSLTRRNIYYNLGIELKTDSNCLDIFKDRQLECSLNFKELTNSTIVLLETTWYNWNWKYRGEDYYYQIFLEKGKKTIELLRFKETSYKKNYQKTDFEDYSFLANEIANRLEIKIKDCAQQSI